MRCGKAFDFHAQRDHDKSRNPHECAVAKTVAAVVNLFTVVATRTNALWQSKIC